MKVNFYATLRAKIGQRTVEVAVPPQATARDLLDAVVAAYPVLRVELLDDNNAFRSQMKFFINGREVIYLEQQFNTRLQLEDRVDIFPPVGGG